tara:strand:+ start:730 stop:930 length:201 start_codon:yes stop_codon:yes gene_type:complete
MKGSLVKWIHDDEPTNVCVVIKEYLTEEVQDLIGKDSEVDDKPLLLVYDFITEEYFYALEDELHFL